MNVHPELNSSESWNLVPLTPEYLEAEHGGYVAAIESALKDERILNIALSGNYGVGKSSILREVARRQNDRVVELSLSTLSPIEPSKLDDSVPKQATTPTNRIQQEIVKQLLYREDPSRTPGSRFRRIERFQGLREVWGAGLVGFAVAVVFLLTGWTAQIASVFTLLKEIGAWTHAIVCGMATGIVFLMRWRFYGKLHIKQFSAASATVTLADNSVSYFDQYLDEIVYFFEVSDRDIVIFEDIDRFNDSHIFETLRALNTLLNSSPQIKNPVRFIYAIKDSIFDSLALKEEGRKLEQDVNDPAHCEVVRANRTKFFDLVIPVVPFITHRSARNLVIKLLGDIKHEVDPELIDLATQYVPDMRLLKNVRNEFIVFRHRIFSGDGKQLNLSESDLFAMVLYKSTHLTDFETIRLGKSNLDTLYTISRKVVTENIKKLEGDCTKIRQQSSRIERASIRSTELGERLITLVHLMAESASMEPQFLTFIFNQANLSIQDLKSESFWANFVTAEASNAVLHCNHRNRTVFQFTRKNLSLALGDPLDAKSWNEADQNIFAEEIDNKTDDIKYLRRADLCELVARPDFLVEFNEKQLSLEAIAKQLLKPGLAYQLVRAGYINRNFTLYTSTFHGDRVSSAATNFIIHHVEQDQMDEYFVLAPGDVDAVVRERGKSALKEPALYNIAILDHLLMTDTEAADIMIHSLVALDDNSVRFLQAYLASGELRQRFIERFTIASSGVLSCFVTLVSLDDSLRLQFVDIALANLSPLKQRADAAVSGYLLMHYAELTTLTSKATTLQQAERIGVLFADAKVTVPNLEPIGQEVRTSFVLRNLYEVTYENLMIVIDNRETVALDAIRAVNEKAYKYVLEHLSSYLEAIAGMSATIDANEQFIVVIEDIIKQEKSHLDDVIKHAALVCEVLDVDEVSNDAWPVLAEHRRFPATFNNVNRYFSVFAVDTQLAKVLTASGEITEVDEAEDDEKATLAIAILAAQELLPSAILRVELVMSLNLDIYIGIEDVTAEAGDLFALLIKNDIIPDDAESYKHIAETDWQTRIAFISESRKFIEYMTPELVQLDLAMLLTSDVINPEIKKLIVEQAEVYAEVADSQGLNELARFATLHGQLLPADVVQKMAQDGVPVQQVITLLAPHLTLMSREQLFTILLALGGDYPQLTEVGYDKPRIPNTPADIALLERLTQEGIVGKYDNNEPFIKVNKKYK